MKKAFWTIFGPTDTNTFPIFLDILLLSSITPWFHKESFPAIASKKKKVSRRQFGLTEARQTRFEPAASHAPLFPTSLRSAAAAGSCASCACTAWTYALTHITAASAAPISFPSVLQPNRSHHPTAARILTIHERDHLAVAARQGSEAGAASTFKYVRTGVSRIKPVSGASLRVVLLRTLQLFPSELSTARASTNLHSLTGGHQNMHACLQLNFSL